MLPSGGRGIQAAPKAAEGKEGGGGGRWGWGGSKAEEQRQQPTVPIEVLRDQYSRPVERGQPPVLCYVVRDRGRLQVSTPVYRMYFENPEATHENGRFIMSAKKRSGNKTTNMLIAAEERPSGDRASGMVLGKVRANWSGSEYVVYDHGLNPEKATSPSSLRCELGLVQFEYDQTGPGRMRVVVPHVYPNGSTKTWRPEGAEDTISETVARDDMQDLITMENKRPQWDAAHGGHVLNFHGRVTESSVKNFQISCPAITGDDSVVLQFGRVSHDTFTMDVHHPLGLLQAFGICLASLDRKLADNKGFDALKRWNDADGAPQEGESKTEAQGTMTGGDSLDAASADYLRNKWRRSTTSRK